jgi:UDP-2,3-diacylglucosamine pyrophosphatase LpxH
MSAGTRHNENTPHDDRLKSGGNPRYRLTPEEAEIIYKYRRIKEEAEKEGLDPKSVHSGWIKNKNASLYFKNTNIKSEFNKLSKQLIKEAKEYSPIYPVLERQKYSDSHLFFLCPSDLHIGKLCRSFVSGNEYNTQEAVIRCLEGVKGCIRKASGFNIDKIVFLLSGDLLHIDNLEGTTTKGTKQDVDGHLSDHFLIAKRLIIDVIKTLVQLADVHVMYTPGNHDNVVGFLIAQILQVHFRNNKNTSWDISLQMRKYYKYHNNLLASTHGDRVKMDLLPMLMADECKQWSATKYRYMFTQHIHHKVSKDYPGLSIESLRSPSEADAWHHKAGYQSSNNKAIEGFLFHKSYGQIARITHLF